MSKATLTTEQVRQMVHQFATNDEFRNLYEQSPAKALAKLGISDEVIAGLDSKCMQPCRLGSKEAFRAANETLDEASAQLFSSFMIPALSFNIPR